MAGKISDYLTTKTADNDYTLSITPKGDIPFIGGGNVEILLGDDGKSEKRIDQGGTPNIFVTIPWTLLSDTDAETVIDCYFSDSKGGRGGKTFKWYNPKDESTYIVRFVNELNWTALQHGTKNNVENSMLKIIGNA